MSKNRPFVFCADQQLVVLTGCRATNLNELLGHIRTVSGSSIFYHTHYLYRAKHFVKPKFFNEFAEWVSEALQERRLAERIGAIDLLSLTSVRELREMIAALVERHLQDESRFLRECPAGDEFYFCEAKSFILPSGVTAHSVREFFDHLMHISEASLLFHMLDARLRFERPTNDFSEWLKDIGEDRAAAEFGRVNPYALPNGELKTHIERIARKYLRRVA